METPYESTETASIQKHAALTELKDALRARHLDMRRARTTEDREVAGRRLAEHAWAALIPGSLVTCYASMPIEPSTDSLRELLRALGKDVALPIMRKGRALAWGFDAVNLEINNFGIGEPEETEIDIAQASALIIPALGAGLDGSRIGRGAGYYDRALATIPLHRDGGPLRIVVVFDDEVHDTVPHEDHDQPVDLIITPSRIIEIN